MHRNGEGNEGVKESVGRAADVFEYVCGSEMSNALRTSTGVLREACRLVAGDPGTVGRAADVSEHVCGHAMSKVLRTSTGVLREACRLVAHDPGIGRPHAGRCMAAEDLAWSWPYRSSLASAARPTHAGEGTQKTNERRRRGWPSTLGCPNGCDQLGRIARTVAARCERFGPRSTGHRLFRPGSSVGLSGFICRAER